MFYSVFGTFSVVAVAGFALTGLMYGIQQKVEEEKAIKQMMAEAANPESFRSKIVEDITVTNRVKEEWGKNSN